VAAAGLHGCSSRSRPWSIEHLRGGSWSPALGVHRIHPYPEGEDILAAVEYAAARERELVAVSELSDLGARAHRIAESPEGGLIDDERSIRRLLDL